MNSSVVSHSARALAVAFAATSLSLGAAALADPTAPAPSAPVATSCTVDYHTLHGFAYSTAYASGLNVAYHDLDARPVAAVNVRVNYDGRTSLVADAFPLASNATQTRSYRTVHGAEYVGRGANCEIQSVTFADGTSWSPSSVASR